MGVRPTVNSAASTDQRQTTCSICGYGIYARQDRIWSKKPLGLIHVDCAPKERP